MICPRVELAARLLAAESQLAECKRRIIQKQAPKRKFTNSFRLLWVILSKVWTPWQKAVHLMQPATVVKWHRSAFRLYWRWKLRHGPGHPPIPQEMQALIRRLSTENPLWGARRIRDTLVLLGFNPPCEDTVRKYMVTSRYPQDRTTNWLAFLRSGRFLQISSTCRARVRSLTVMAIFTSPADSSNRYIDSMLISASANFLASTLSSPG